MAEAGWIDGVRETCSLILERRGCELFDLTYGREGRRRVLRVVVERIDGNVGLDEMAEISEEISRAMDLTDPVPGTYSLEVSSPGVERPLLRPEHYARFVGRMVDVRCHELVEGRGHFIGEIRSAGEETFVLGMDEGVVELPYVVVSSAKLVVDWAAELKGAGVKGD